MSEQGDGRAEQAFRDAFSTRGEEAPHEPLVVATAPRRRTWWIAAAAAAAVAAAVIVPTLVLGGDDKPERNSVTDQSSSAVVVLAPGHRWRGYRTVEVQVPEDWPFGSTPVELDCSYLAGEPYRGPDRPYVEIDTGMGGTVDADCLLPDPPSDAHAEFGPWPRDTWQSHVTLAEPSDDIPDGSWTYGGWTLTRETFDDVQVIVLASPGDAALTGDVLTSVRTVDMDANGCPTGSPAQDPEFQVPTAAPVPDDGWRGVVAVCQYSRGLISPPGLIGSRQFIGAAARSLVAAINDAPLGGGPDRPQNCVHDEYGETALLLRFLPGDRSDPTGSYPEAYVYYDHCFGNGIVDSARTRQLTQANCEPLFAEQPVTLWVAQSNVGELCNPFRG